MPGSHHKHACFLAHRAKGRFLRALLGGTTREHQSCISAQFGRWGLCKTLCCCSGTTQRSKGKNLQLYFSKHYLLFSLLFDWADKRPIKQRCLRLENVPLREALYVWSNVSIQNLLVLQQCNGMPASAPPPEK